MIYNEILSLKDYFNPVYDLENEKGSYWKQFVPNDKFYKVLSSVLNSFDSNNPENTKSFYLQAAYGTGKSHATSVVKHLLYDDLKDIEDFEIGDTQLKFKLKGFRSNKKVFPVVLKGTGIIHDNRTFALVLEKAVKDSLKKEGINLDIKTDYEKVIQN